MKKEKIRDEDGNVAGVAYYPFGRLEFKKSALKKMPKKYRDRFSEPMPAIFNSKTGEQLYPPTP